MSDKRIKVDLSAFGAYDLCESSAIRLRDSIDEQLKHEPSEPEKVIDTEQESVAILVAAQAKRIAALQSELNTLKDQIGHPWVFTTIGSPTMEQFTQLKSEVAKLAEDIYGDIIRIPKNDTPALLDILTRNRKES